MEDTILKDIEKIKGKLENELVLYETFSHIVKDFKYSNKVITYKINQIKDEIEFLENLKEEINNEQSKSKSNCIN